MVERDESLGSGDVGIVGVAVLGSETTIRGEAKAVFVGAGAEAKLREPLLLLRDPWYCSTSLYPAIRAIEVSPLGVPRKWILKGKALSHETAWVQLLLV